MCTVQPLGEIKIGGRNPCEHLFFFFSRNENPHFRFGNPEIRKMYSATPVTHFHISRVDFRTPFSRRFGDSPHDKFDQRNHSTIWSKEREISHRFHESLETIGELDETLQCSKEIPLPSLLNTRIRASCEARLQSNSLLSSVEWSSTARSSQSCQS